MHELTTTLIHIISLRAQLLHQHLVLLGILQDTLGTNVKCLKLLSVLFHVNNCKNILNFQYCLVILLAYYHFYQIQL